MSAMPNLTSVLNQLQHERIRLASQLERLTNALSALGTSTNSGRRRGRVSRAGRARIAAAQRARWAKVKGRRVVPIATRKGLSASARRRIASAQRLRWAKWRREQRKTA